MVGEGGANLKDVRRVHKDGQISALSMVAAVGASLKDAIRVRNGGQISARCIGRVCSVRIILPLKLCHSLLESVMPRNPERQ